MLTTVMLGTIVSVATLSLFVKPGTAEAQGCIRSASRATKALRCSEIQSSRRGWPSQKASIPGGDHFRSLKEGSYKLIERSNNKIVWVGGGNYPFTTPPRFSVTTDRSVYHFAKNKWLDRYPRRRGERKEVFVVEIFAVQRVRETQHQRDIGIGVDRPPVGLEEIGEVVPHRADANQLRIPPALQVAARGMVADAALVDLRTLHRNAAEAHHEAGVLQHGRPEK
jgi:hypothetical protein